MSRLDSKSSNFVTCVLFAIKLQEERFCKLVKIILTEGGSGGNNIRSHNCVYVRG